MEIVSTLLVADALIVLIPLGMAYLMRGRVYDDAGDPVSFWRYVAVSLGIEKP